MNAARIDRAITRAYAHCRRLLAAARHSLERGDARGALDVLEIVAMQRDAIADRRLALRLGRTVVGGEGGATHARRNRCACHRGTYCTIAHDPAACACDLCRAAEAGHEVTVDAGGRAHIGALKKESAG